MDDTKIVPQACAAVEVLARRLGEILRTVPDPTLPVSPQWSIRDAAAHLLSGTGLYCELAAGNASPLAEFSSEALAKFNAERIADIGEPAVDVLAAELVAAVAEYADIATTRAADSPIRWHAGFEVTLAQLTGTLLGEYVLHGYDIARACPAVWPVPAEHAALTLYGYAPLTAAGTDPATNRSHTGSYRLDLGLAGRSTVRFVAGAASFGNDEAPVDCEIHADPDAFLLIRSGRLRQTTAVSLQLMHLTGPRPELGLRFLDLFRAFP
jgi:hypothetical protein